MTLAQCGVFASSRSANQTFAPEFRALIIILRSVGPVISTRRSRRSGGAGATCQSPSRTAAVSGQEVQPAGAGDLVPLGPAGRQQLVPAVREPLVEEGDELQRPVGEDLRGPRHGWPGNL